MALLSSVSNNTLIIYILVSALILYPIYKTIYALFFSPLSRIPGPWTTRISNIPEANALKAQQRTKWATDLFLSNPGAVAIRTSPNSVSFNHPDAVKAIYGINPIQFEFIEKKKVDDIQDMQKAPPASENQHGTTPSPQPANPSSQRVPKPVTE
jgi:hypothetical protein